MPGLPTAVTAKVFEQYLPCRFIFLPDKAQPHQEQAHGELLIFLLDFAVTGAFLRQRLMVECERQHDICSDFPGMERAVETSEFHRVVAVEETVQVEEVVTAVMVVAVPVPGILLIPDVL